MSWYNSLWCNGCCFSLSLRATGVRIPSAPICLWLTFKSFLYQIKGAWTFEEWFYDSEIVFWGTFGKGAKLEAIEAKIRAEITQNDGFLDLIGVFWGAFSSQGLSEGHDRLNSWSNRSKERVEVPETRHWCIFKKGACDNAKNRDF